MSLVNVALFQLSASHLPNVAAIHQRAFSSSALTRLGVEAVRRYYEWQLVGPHDVFAIGANAGQQIVGYCFGGTFNGAMSGYLRRNRAYLAWRLVTHPGLISNSIIWKQLNAAIRILLRKHPAPKLDPMAPPFKRSFGILAVAVDPEHQGHGIGRCLMEASEAEARRRDFLHMHLTVQPDNAPTIAFYESIGWKRLITDGVFSGSMSKALE